ncbi:MAG: hypothetical protein U1G07_08890 [Verrucomicrobiota bacterium]
MGRSNGPVLGKDMLVAPGDPRQVGGSNYVIVRYTLQAPDVQTYGSQAIAGSFRELNPVGNSVEVAVFKNNDRLFYANGASGT